MAQISVTVPRQISAPADTVYQCIADYQHHHGKWLPPEYSKYRTEEADQPGQVLVLYHLKTGRRERDYSMRISEPERGRTIQEADTASSLVKTWTVEPAGSKTRVSIDTRWQGSGGIGGFFERTFAPRVLTALYADELARLDTYAREQAR
ncbi:MAG: SRPBCC family protein [Chloroflexota bacterium]|nr:MAG: SRPBCC family protein [Chloroflexota bacterium]